MQFKARAELPTKMYSEYIAGANERSNEEMRRLWEFYKNARLTYTSCPMAKRLLVIQ